METFQRAHNLWIEKRKNGIDAEQKTRRAPQKAEDHFQELDMSMVEYAKAWETKNPEPKFYQYYHPSESQKKKDYVFALASIGAIGVVAYYVL